MDERTDTVGTVSGWLAAHLGRLPRVGDEVKVAGGTVKVERVANHRADRIRVVVDRLESTQVAEVQE
jgi:putative hemolysin